MLVERIALLKLVDCRLRHACCLRREPHAGRDTRRKADRRGAQGLAQVHHGAQGRQQGAQLTRVGLEALKLKAIGEGAVERVSHQPRVVMTRDAGIRRGDRERVPSREGGGGEGGGQRERVPTERIRVGRLRIGGAWLELLQLVEEVICLLLQLRIRAAVLSGAMRPAMAGKAAARAGTATGKVAIVLIVVIAAASATCSRRPGQGFGILQQCRRSSQIARLDRGLELRVSSWANDSIESSPKRAWRGVGGFLEEKCKAGCCAGRSRRKINRGNGRPRAGRSGWWKH